MVLESIQEINHVVLEFIHKFIHVLPILWAYFLSFFLILCLKFCLNCSHWCHGYWTGDLGKRHVQLAFHVACFSVGLTHLELVCCLIPSAHVFWLILDWYLVLPLPCMSWLCSILSEVLSWGHIVLIHEWSSWHDPGSATGLQPLTSSPGSHRVQQNYVLTGLCVLQHEYLYVHGVGGSIHHGHTSSGIIN